MTPADLAAHPRVREAFWALKTQTDNPNGSMEAEQETCDTLISTVLAVYHESLTGEGLDFEAAYLAGFGNPMPESSSRHTAGFRIALNAQHRARVAGLEARIAEMNVAIADVKAKEECRPHAISSTSLRNAVQNLYRFLEPTP